MGTGMKLFGAGFSKKFIKTTTNPFIGFVYRYSINLNHPKLIILQLMWFANGGKTWGFSHDLKFQLFGNPNNYRRKYWYFQLQIFCTLPQIEKIIIQKSFLSSNYFMIFLYSCVVVLFPIQLANIFRFFSQ